MTTSFLSGKVAVISGGGRGLGKSMALALASAGVQIALVGRSREHLDETAGLCREVGNQTEVFCADVLKEEDVLELEKSVMAKFGAVHILINNAGINIRKPVTEFSLEEWNRVMGTNMTGVFLLTRSFLRHMKGQGYGRIINMTSIMSHIALPGRSAYCASKAGLLGFTKAVALEVAGEGITVNGISPGPFATEMNIPVMTNPEANQQFISRIPLGRWGKVEEIGKLVLFLCSEDASFITGTDILIDGGWTAQ